MIPKKVYYLQLWLYLQSHLLYEFPFATVEKAAKINNNNKKEAKNTREMTTYFLKTTITKVLPITI